MFPGAPSFPNSPQVTPQAIFDAACSLLVGNPNDKTVFSNAVLQPYFNLAYPELIAAATMAQTNRVRRDFYTVVPAYTTELNPLAIGVVDMDEPELVWEAQNATIIPIATVGRNSPVQVTTQAPHGLASNAQVNAGGTLGTSSVQGRWFVTVIDSLNVTLNGSVSDGNTGTGGYLVSTGAQFQPVISDDQTGNDNRPLSNYLETYSWVQSTFQFRGATSPVLIHVRYWINGNPPQNPAVPIGLEGCFGYLSYRVAGKAAESKGWFQLADRYTTEAIGPKREADMTGGLLRTFLASQVLRMQRQQYRRSPFRENTTAFPGSMIFY
jgi:hypothetical protein